MTDSIKLSGIAASMGIAAGAVKIIQPFNIDFDSTTGHSVESELKRFKEAQQRARGEITEMKSAAAANDEWALKIFDSHLFLIGDPELQNNVNKAIKSEGVSAEYALLSVRDTIVAMFESLDDETMKERASDLRDVTNRILAILSGQPLPDFSSIASETIIAAVELSPLETARIDSSKIKGFITQKGGYSSHTAIIARSLGIPAVTGITGLMDSAVNGVTALLDGERGEVILNPSKAEIEDARVKAESFEVVKKRLEVFKNKHTETKDGFKVEINSHLGGLDELERVSDSGAEGIGLFRTEFMFMQRNRYPEEEYQFDVYRRVLSEMAPKPVIIRTMDIGGDKQIPYAGIAEEANPFLGLRGLRFALKKPELFKPQLRALLRAAKYGNLKIMFPMVSTVSELREAKALLDEVRLELDPPDSEAAAGVDVGIMIEVPAAALCADQLAEEADFFSIGTNDLIQYTMAADRMNEEVSYLYQPLNPGVLALIKMTAEAAERHNISVGVCGEMGGDLLAVPYLLGLGITELSVAPPDVTRIREFISRQSMAEMRSIAHNTEGNLQ